MEVCCLAPQAARSSYGSSKNVSLFGLNGSPGDANHRPKRPLFRTAPFATVSQALDLLGCARGLLTMRV